MKIVIVFAALIIAFLTSPAFSFPDDFSIWNYYCHQCHGDGNGTKAGLSWVSVGDLSMITPLYGHLPVNYPDPLYSPAIDYDRNFVIDDADLDIIEQWLGKTNVPCDCGKKLSITAVSQPLTSNTYYNIQWNWRIYTAYIPFPGSQDHPGTQTLYYSIDAGLNWIQITNVAPNVRNYNWLVPQMNSDQCLIKIVDSAHSGLEDITAITIEGNQTSFFGDFDGDSCVDNLDLYVFIQYWLDPCSQENNWCQGADFQQNEIVNFADFAMLADNWFLCQEP